MKNFIVMTALSLCSFGQIFISYSESHTVEVQPGENVTLLSKNISKYEAVTFWFRLVDRNEANCISVMINFNKVEYCKTFQSGRFQMGTNVSSVFLNIQKVDLSDSGLYLCGFYIKGRPSFTVIHLNVKGSNELHDDMESKSIKEWYRTLALMGVIALLLMAIIVLVLLLMFQRDESAGAKLTSVILGSLTVFQMMVIIVLVVKILKLQTAHREGQSPEQREKLGSDNLNSAAVKFLPKTVRNRRPASERQEETCVIYQKSEVLY